MYVCMYVLWGHISIIHLINVTPEALSLSACRKGRACTNIYVYHVMLLRSFVNYDELMTFVYVKRVTRDIHVFRMACFRQLKLG